MIPQISATKYQNYSVQQQKNEGILKIFDNSTYALTIILSDQDQNQTSLISDNLSILLDNLQNLTYMFYDDSKLQRNNFFLKKLYFRNMDKSQQIPSNNTSSQSFLESENSQTLFESIKDALSLQNKQTLGNILLFDIYNENLKYNQCFLTACQTNKNQNQKIIFINISGLDHCDNIYENEYVGKLNYLYINFKEFSYQDKQNNYFCGNLYQKNYLNLYFNYGQNKVFSWDQFKLIYRLHIKKLVNKFRSNLFVLSIAKSLNTKASKKYIKFDDDCLKRIIEKFCKLAQNKLFIYLILLDSENQFNQQTKCQDMVQFLNCIQQGAIGNKIKSKVNFDINKHINWLKEFVNIQIQVKLDPIFLIMYQRQLRNLLINNTITNSKEILQESTLMILNMKEIYTQTFLYYEHQKLQFIFNSLLHVDYQNKLVVLLQQDEFQKHQYYLYYSEIQDNQYQMQCQRILLNNYVDDILLIDSHNKASLQVKRMMIKNNQCFIYIHSLNSDIILEIQCFDNPSVKILERNKIFDKYDNSKYTKLKTIIKDQQKISDLVQNRRGPCVVQNSPISETDFMIIGGEFSNDPQICNIVEIVKLEQMAQQGFYSFILQKEVLFAKGSFIPWPYMFVLSSNQQPQQYIFLPGDYNNQINCYNKPIVNVYQNYAYQMTTIIDSFQFQWTKLQIIYDNSNLDNSQPFPIHYFSGNQSNILQIEMNKWIIAKTINKQILFGSKGKIEFFEFINDSDSNVSFEQMIITAEITVDQNNLIIKEKFHFTEQYLIQQKDFVNFTSEDIIRF